ncbi:aminomethyltransferase, mitochondrial [Acyrthosiphon pisum]|uniref:Aminomethyltransferase n=1 Tax=Acyrthosiphon pisum TaxID=7029 RepID=A0A8R1W4X1_ACYPI|nr:aminomethyltransferase, mitochondrial [Acyrthosiphon pisum]|eukprot:XP_003241237.1 PREDICTED: aminomethyltransferase, mitochondrial [Acyrthosiphon pisum]
MSLFKLNCKLTFFKLRLPARSYGSDVRKTKLHEFHIRHGGKMVPFAGYMMPVKYADSIASSHLHTRRQCSLFDVSHMLQTKIHGKHREQFMEQICVTDVQNLGTGKSALSLFIDDRTGGILDDLIITKTDGDFLYMVTNAGCKEQDMRMLTEQLSIFKSSGHDASLEFLDSDEQSLLALQGPRSAAVLQSFVDGSTDLSALYFMDSTTATVCGVPDCRVTRCGYTGEDGFEISVPSDRVEAIAESFVAQDDVKLAGLGARDTLRLEAGMCLHGADISSETTPVEAALMWTISRKRRDECRYPGATVILKQLGDGAQRKRVGLVQKAHGAPVRGGAVLFNVVDGAKIGSVTSGCPSPTLSQNIAMGYVDSTFSKNGTEIQAEVRGQKIPMVVTKMPFVKPNYYSKPK